MNVKYPPIQPYETGFLEVGSGHKLYWEECGNQNGIPVIFLHGGPGSGTEPSHRCYFDPKAYRIILMDQRGAGRSLPHASLVDNTTWHLVSDLETLRIDRNVDKWIVFGGSWGSTLALAYSETYPARVLGLIVRGIFLAQQREIDWFYQDGASRIFTDEWEKFLDPIPLTEREHLVAAYYRQLTSSEASVRKRATLAWTAWEAAALKLLFDPVLYKQFIQDDHADALARIECHYFLNKGFFKTDHWLLEHAGALAQIPGMIIQGRYDMICPFESAWKLHKAWPKATFKVIKDAGHAASEPGITDALIDATNHFVYEWY